MDDPFGIIGLPRRFSLSASEISAAHLRAVSRLHPDRASNPLERDRLVQAAAAAGSAKQRLLKDTSRAEELMELLGARPLLAAPLPAGFLMETMEIREAIDEAISSGTPDELSRISAQVRALRDGALAELQESLEVALAATDAGRRDPGATAAAAAALVRILPPIARPEASAASMDATISLVRAQRPFAPFVALLRVDQPEQVGLKRLKGRIRGRPRAWRP